VFVVVADFGWSLASGGDSGALYGVVDLPLHLLTVAALLLAVAAWRGRLPSAAFVIAALVASVALDLDHVPGYLGSHVLMGSGPRPYSHSLATIAVLVAGAAALHGRSRAISLGAAFGVGGHLLRDLATGPGIPLVWPVSASAVSIPYALFVAALLAAVGMAAGRRAQRSALPAWGRHRSRPGIAKPMES
jgi:inner membrane protein